MTKTKRVSEEEITKEESYSESDSESGSSSEDSDVEEDQAQKVPTVKPKVKRARLNDLPTKDEQLQLNNTDTLLRSNLLKLQVQEMLKEVSCDEINRKKKAQKILTECVDMLKGIKGGGAGCEGNHFGLAKGS